MYRERGGIPPTLFRPSESSLDAARNASTRRLSSHPYPPSLEAASDPAVDPGVDPAVDPSPSLDSSPLDSPAHPAQSFACVFFTNSCAHKSFGAVAATTLASSVSSPLSSSTERAVLSRRPAPWRPLVLDRTYSRC